MSNELHIDTSLYTGPFDLVLDTLDSKQFMLFSVAYTYQVTAKSDRRRYRTVRYTFPHITPVEIELTRTASSRRARAGNKEVLATFVGQFGFKPQATDIERVNAVRSTRNLPVFSYVLNGTGYTLAEAESKPTPNSAAVPEKQATFVMEILSDSALDEAELANWRAGHANRKEDGANAC